MTALNLNAASANTPSTSGSYTFSVTRDQIIRLAMLDIGALQEGENPTAQEMSDCALKLNMLVKQWMGDTDFAPGLKVWTRKRADLFMNFNQFTYQIGQTGRDNWIESTTGLIYPQNYGQTTLSTTQAAGATVLPVAATSQLNVADQIGVQTGAQSIYWTTIAAIDSVALTVTIAAPGLPTGGAPFGAFIWNYTVKGIRPLRLISAVLRDQYQNDTPLRTMTVERYESLPTKTSPNSVGDPTAVFYEARYKQQSPNGQIYLDVGCPADITKHIHCVYLAPIEDFVNPGDAPDYPQEWFRPLVLGTGRDIAGMFDCSWDLGDSLTEAIAIARQGNPATTDAYFQVNGDDPYGL
jgi:hypothetical protein